MSILMMNEYSPIISASAENKSKIQLLIGQEVFELLSDENFKAEWNTLYHTCSWATAFQSWEFVSSWYYSFQKDYSPVLIKSENNGKLDGLLTMAIPISGSTCLDINHKSITLIGAGEYEAEYQCWLANASNGELFITSALSELLSHFPYGKILFRFIPPGAPMKWVEADPRWKNLCVRQSFTRPLMELNTPTASKVFRINNQYKTKLNRLRRLGEVSFEKITDINIFEQALDDISLQFDFRQGGMFNKNQFREKPSRVKFMLELFRKGLLHVTVLKVRDEIIASMVAVAGKNWVHLQGINTHSPFYARQSPGILHFLKLGKLLSDERVAVFDLTPGGDPYKEKMATTHDHVHGLVVTNSIVYRTKRYVKKQIHSQLIKAGKRPMTVELTVEKNLYLFKKRIKKIKENGSVEMLSKWIKKLTLKKNGKIYTKQVKSSPVTSLIEIKKDNLSHMLDFESKGTSKTRWEFLEEAMKLYEFGNHSYTWSRDGQLLVCAWIGQVPSLPKKKEIDFSPIPEDALVLKKLYCHPEGESKLTDFISCLITSLESEDSANELYAMLDVEEEKVCQALASAGFSASYP